MKLIFLATLFLTNVHASYTFEITKVCEETPHLSEEINSKEPIFLSELTLAQIEKHQITFTGNKYGIKTMLNSPPSEMYANIEIISDSKLRSYGWCVEIDGQLAETTMDQVYLKPKHIEHIRWFYAYADYDSGEWLNYCIPVYKNPHPYICKGLWRNTL